MVLTVAALLNHDDVWTSINLPFHDVPLSFH
jgi:hypothetical protein